MTDDDGRKEDVANNAVQTALPRTPLTSLMR